MQEINMPDVKRGATLKHIYEWLYNGGSYGRRPTIGDMLDKGWGELLRMGIVYYDTSNDDIRYRWDSDGRSPVVERWSPNISTNTSSIQWAVQEGAVRVKETPHIPTSTTYGKYVRRIKKVQFTSNAGGTLDADVELVPAEAGYFGVCQIKSIYSKDVGGAANPTLYFSTASHDKFDAISLSTSGDFKPVVDFENCSWYYEDDDNEPITLDTDCSGLGSIKTWVVEIWYWLET